MDQESATRYVLAECVETGITRCFARIPPRCERQKDPFRRREYTINWYPQHSLTPIYSGDRNWAGLKQSPFWRNPRLATKSQIPTGVEIP